MNAKKTAEKKTDKAPSTNVKAPKLTKAQAERGAGLIAYGKTVKVLFGDLVRDNNVRGIPPTHEDKERMRESIAEKGMLERFDAFKRADGKWQIVSGGTRFDILVALDMPKAFEVEIIEVPEPRNRAEDRVLQLARNNVRNEMQWPDVARAVGEAMGILDEKGEIRSDAEIKKGVREGKFKTNKQIASECGYQVQYVDRYARVARAPYADLVTIWSLNGSLTHGEVYAKYEPAMRPAMLTVYKRDRAFPVEAVPPPRQRAAGAGRPRKDATPNKGAAAKAGKASESTCVECGVAIEAGRWQRCDHNGSCHEIVCGKKCLKAHKDSHERHEARNKPPGTPTAPTQESLFVDPSGAAAPAAAPAEGIGSAVDVSKMGPGPVFPPFVRPDHEVADIADAFGIAPDMVRLFDSLANCWDVAPLAEWKAPLRERCRVAVDLYMNTPE